MTSELFFVLIIVTASVLMLFVLYRILRYRFSKVITESETILSVELIKAGVFVSGGIVLHEVVPIFQVLSKVLSSSFAGNELILKECMYLCVFCGTAIIYVLVLTWLSTILYTVFRKGRNIFIDAGNNELSSVILMVGILFGLSLATSAGLNLLLEHLVPYPSAPIYH